MISGNVIGGIVKYPDTIILRDEDGNEYAAVPLEEEVELTGTANDVREGITVANEKGVLVGEKVIPSYNTWQGTILIPDGSALTITNYDQNIDYHEYTELQSIICAFNTTILDSVSAEKVTIGNILYNVLSTDVVSTIVKNTDDRTIEYGVSNDTGAPCIIRFFMYKEIQ